MSGQTIRIAMWSGPRNLSTAMMRSFASRGDCGVWDEPFYGVYLKMTGIEHPLRDQTLSAWETDFDKVRTRCQGPAPDGEPLFYQKHMTHHMLNGAPLDWIAGLTNIFLIRHPARVIQSYAAKRQNPALADLGFVRQSEIFEHATALTGTPPIVLDSDDLLRDPKRQLQALCDRIGITFTDRMLSWPAGRRKEDGPWGSHWYGSVWQSTGFASPSPLKPAETEAHQRLINLAMPHYAGMRAHRLKP